MGQFHLESGQCVFDGIKYSHFRLLPEPEQGYHWQTVREAQQLPNQSLLTSYHQGNPVYLKQTGNEVELVEASELNEGDQVLTTGGGLHYQLNKKHWQHYSDMDTFDAHALVLPRSGYAASLCRVKRNFQWHPGRIQRHRDQYFPVRTCLTHEPGTGQVGSYEKGYEFLTNNRFYRHYQVDAIWQEVTQATSLPVQAMPLWHQDHKPVYACQMLDAINLGWVVDGHCQPFSRYLKKLSRYKVLLSRYPYNQKHYPGWYPKGFPIQLIYELEQWYSDNGAHICLKVQNGRLLVGREKTSQNSLTCLAAGEMSL